MSKMTVIVFLLVVFFIIFEWRQLVSDVDTSPRDSQNEKEFPKREEAIKEKIILSQEKNIQNLNEVVRSLREQLQQCGCYNKTLNRVTLTSFPENVTEIERDQNIED